MEQSETERGGSNSAGDLAAAADQLSVQERGDVVGLDDDDAHAQGTTKLVDNLGMAVHFDYVNADGLASTRAVRIDGLYGDSLDRPLYLIGLDTLSGERRTFRLDRIAALRREGRAPITEKIAWWIGGMARAAAGLEINRPPFGGALASPIVVTVSRNGRQTEYIGNATAFELDYPRGAPVAWIEVTGGGGGSQKNVIRERRFQLHPPRGVVSVADGETGEVIDDILAWCAVRLGYDRDGIKRLVP